MVKTNNKISISGTVTRYIGGFLMSILTTTIMLKIFNNIVWGITSGTIINSAACYYMTKKYKNDESIKKIMHGAIAGIIILLIATISTWIIINAAFQGIAN